MEHLNPTLTRLVQYIAIKSRLDFLVKNIVGLTLLSGLIYTLEYIFMPPEVRQTPLELAPIIIIGGTLIQSLFFTVVTHQDKLRQSLERAANYDELTGTPNRRHFIATLQDRLSAGEIGHLILLDADRFKMINDTFGHAAGDAGLKAIADRIASLLGPDDLYGRLGGEEFGVYLKGISASRLKLVEEGLTKEMVIELADRDPPSSFQLTLSAGVTETAVSVPLEKLMHFADLALYRAKAAGRARSSHFEIGLVQAS